MGRAIDLFVTYRFLRLLTTPFEDTDAFKLGIIDKKGNRIDWAYDFIITRDKGYSSCDWDDEE